MTLETEILFRTFPDQDRDAFMGMGELVPFQEGEVVLQAGRSAWDLYVVREGEVSVWVGNVKLADLTEGQIIDSSAVLFPQIQWSAVRGNSSGVMQCVEREELLAFFEGRPQRQFQQFCVNIFKIWVQVLNQRNGRVADVQRQFLASAPDRRERRHKLLVVDDEEEIRDVITEIFAERFDVVTAEDGRAAIEVAMAEKPDLILLDLRLPELDRYEVCKRLKTHPETGYVPIVMVTALSATPDKVKGIMYGADEYLVKPVDLEKLLQTVDRILEKTYR